MRGRIFAALFAAAATGSVVALGASVAAPAPIPPERLCLEGDCLLCLLGRPLDSPEVTRARQAYDMDDRGQEWWGNTVSLWLTSSNVVYSLTQHPAKCNGAHCPLPTPLGFTPTSTRTDVERILPGGEWKTDWVTKQPSWEAPHPLGLKVKVVLDSDGGVGSVDINGLQADLPALHARYCREGENPRVSLIKPFVPSAPPSAPTASAAPPAREVAAPAAQPAPPASGTASSGDDDLMAAARGYAANTDFTAQAERIAAAKAEAERLQVVQPAKIEAAEAFARAQRHTLGAVQYYLEGIAHDDPRQGAALIVNGNGDISSVAYDLNNAARALGEAMKVCEAHDLGDEGARLADIQKQTLELKAAVDRLYAKTPRAGALEGMSDAARLSLIAITDALGTLNNAITSLLEAL